MLPFLFEVSLRHLFPPMAPLKKINRESRIGTSLLLTGVAFSALLQLVHEIFYPPALGFNHR